LHHLKSNGPNTPTEKLAKANSNNHMQIDSLKVHQQDQMPMKLGRAITPKQNSQSRTNKKEAINIAESVKIEPTEQEARERAETGSPEPRHNQM
jgi:hypothetical protein